MKKNHKDYLKSLLKPSLGKATKYSKKNAKSLLTREGVIKRTGNMSHKHGRIKWI